MFSFKFLFFYWEIWKFIFTKGGFVCLLFLSFGTWNFLSLNWFPVCFVYCLQILNKNNERPVWLLNNLDFKQYCLPLAVGQLRAARHWRQPWSLMVKERSLIHFDTSMLSCYCVYIRLRYIHQLLKELLEKLCIVNHESFPPFSCKHHLRFCAEIESVSLSFIYL